MYNVADYILHFLSSLKCYTNETEKQKIKPSLLSCPCICILNKAMHFKGNE